jgi:hypothetical protein
MPITNYSVLQGLPTAGKVVSGTSTHYQITMQATGGPLHRRSQHRVHRWL